MKSIRHRREGPLGGRNRADNCTANRPHKLEVQRSFFKQPIFTIAPTTTTIVTIVAIDRTGITGPSPPATVVFVPFEGLNMKWFMELWQDERGAVLSAEVVTVGTVAVLGAIAGLSVAGNAVNGEMKDFAYAIRSLDQSYAYNGHRSCGAYTAGSCYTQQDVQESIQALCADPENAAETTKSDGATPTPIITDEAPPKPNQLPEPEKKAKKKPKEKRDDDDDKPATKSEKSNGPSKPPQSRSDNDDA